MADQRGQNGDNGRMLSASGFTPSTPATLPSPPPLYPLPEAEERTGGPGIIQDIQGHSTGATEAEQLALRLATLTIEVTALSSRLDSLKTPTPSPQVEELPSTIRRASTFVPDTYEEYRQTQWEKDMHRMAKLATKKRLSPMDEEELEDTLYEWEQICNGAGINTQVLVQLLLQLGSPAITWAMSEMNVRGLTWPLVKDKLARNLFPYSSYVRCLEAEMMKEDRGKPLEGALVVLARQFDRHGNLCRRWNRDNTFTGSRKKEALLQKVHSDLLERCMCIKNIHTVSYAEFVDHCLMIDAAATDAAIVKKLKPPRRLSEKMTGVTPTIQAVTTTAISPSPPAVMALTATSSASSKEAPTCYNCGEKGHYNRDCPKPRIRCGTCGRLGHKTELCFRTQKEGPHSTTRTSTLRMTKRGVHFDLVDEATKRTFFDVMRKYIEQQDDQCLKAQERAKKKREDDKVVEMTDAPATRPLYDSSEVLGAVFMSVQPANAVEVPVLEVLPEKQIDKQVTDSHYVNLQVLGLEIPALLDSGVVVSLFPAVMWQALPPDRRQGIPECSPGAYPLVGIGGTFNVQVIVELPICVAGVHVSQRFFITAAVTTPILGMDAFTCLGIQINFGTGEIYMEGSSQAEKVSAGLGVTPLCGGVKVCEADDVNDLKGEGCTDDELAAAMAIFNKWEDVWKNPQPGKCTLATHHIITKDAYPVTNRVQRLSPEKMKELQRHIEELTASGAIRPSKSPWSSPVVLVPKPDGTMRLCIDYRALNGITVPDKYPLPRITDLLDKLNTAKISSTLDLAAGFHQIPLSEDSKAKTAFITPKGLYEYTVLPFGLVNAPGTFQRVIDMAFRNFTYPDEIRIYLDDIVIFTDAFDRHLLVLEEVLKTLKQAKLYVNIRKVKLYSRKVKYLGLIIQDGIVTPDEQQVKALDHLKTLKDVTGVRRFLGLTGYFRHFIPHFSQKAQPLTSLLKKATLFVWSQSCQEAWETLKEALKGPGVRLMLPSPSRMYVLDTDASTLALGAVLMQQNDQQQLRPIAFASRTLSPPEQNWTTREQEAYAVVWGILHFSAYLRWQPHFIVRSDHQSLRWLWKTDNKRITRWALLLQEYNFTLQYVRGENHAHVDIFSRDVRDEPVDAEAAARIEAKPYVFQVEEEEKEEEEAFSFPTYDEVNAAQLRECTDEKKEALCLRRGRQGLLENEGGQVYVPEKLRRPIMYFYHFGRMGVHQGVNKVFKRIKKMFWWPSLRADLQEYHGSCLTCARRRPMPPVGYRGHLLAPHIGAIVAIDMVGPIKVRNEYIELLTITDHFTRYAHAVRLPSGDAQAIWDALYREWITYFGAPIQLLSDNAPAFRNRLFLKNANEHHIQRVYAFPYHPQGNGIVEAFHIYLKRALTAMLRQTDWPLSRILPTILMAYRSMPHIATGETPFYLLTGMDMVIPGLQDWTPTLLPDEPGGRLDTIQAMRREAFDQMARAAVEQEAKKKKRPRDATLLRPGTLVLHWLSHEERKSLASQFGGPSATPLWSGPCRVLRKLPNQQDTYAIQPIWEISKAKTYRRERLVPIPRNWGAEELYASLLELVADLKRPVSHRKRKRRPLLPVEDVPPEQQQQTKRQLEGVQTVLEQYMGERLPDEDEIEDEVETAANIATNTTGFQHWGREAEDGEDGRNRGVSCVGWKEVVKWLSRSRSNLESRKVAEAEERQKEKENDGDEIYCEGDL